MLGGASGVSRQGGISSRHTALIIPPLSAAWGSCLIRDSAPAILTIRGLLWVGDLDTTILAGGRLLVHPELTRAAARTYG